MYTYQLGIHSNNENYEEDSISFAAPVSKGDIVSLYPGGDEYEVFLIVHSGDGDSVIHARPISD